MKKIFLLILFILIAAILSAGFGYFFGYDHGYEKSVGETKQLISSCETEAENAAREDLKPKYGDPLRMELILSSPHYRDRYSQCLDKRGM